MCCCIESSSSKDLPLRANILCVRTMRYRPAPRHRARDYRGYALMHTNHPEPGQGRCRSARAAVQGAQGHLETGGRRAPQRPGAGGTALTQLARVSAREHQSARVRAACRDVGRVAAGARLAWLRTCLDSAAHRAPPRSPPRTSHRGRWLTLRATPMATAPSWSSVVNCDIYPHK